MGRVVLAFMAFQLGACSSSGDGPSLRMNVRVVHEFPEVSVDCLTDSSCPQYASPTIVDVAREGDTVALLYGYPRHIDGSFYTTVNGVVVSRDLGETWTHLEQGPFDPGVLAWSAVGARGIAIRDGEIYTTLPYEPEDGVVGATENRQDVSHLASSGTVEVGTINVSWLFDSPTSLHPGVFGYDYWGPSVVFTSRWGEWDLRDASLLGGAEMTLTFDPSQSPCGGGGPWRAAADGAGTVTLYGSCHRADGLTCAGYAVLPDRWIPYFACVADADWPVPAELRGTEATVHPTANHGAVLFVEPRAGGDFTRAARLVSDGVATAVDVGPGRPLMTQPDAAVDDTRPTRTEPMHHRWADLVALVEDLPESRTLATLYRSSGSGFVPTTLPTRPCREGADCGYRPIDNQTGDFFPSVVQWALSIGGDDYLIFYVLDQRPDMRHLRNAIYVAREHLDRGAGTPGSRLEVACARAAACGAPGAIDVCVGRWLDAMLPAASVEAFASATTCEALFRADPTLRAGAPCAPNGATCEGNVAVECVGGVLVRALDCTLTRGTCALPGDDTATCEYAGCPSMANTCDAGGRAVLCAGFVNGDCPGLGLECAVSSGGFATCVDRSGACAGVPVGAGACRGRVSLTCQEANRGAPIADCGRVGLDCDAATARCAGDGSCDETYFPRCEGPHLRYCLDGSLRDIDCAGLGGGCSNDGNPHCTGDAPAPVDAGVPMADAGPTCGGAVAMGAPLPEVGVSDYPTPTGGAIADGTYVLTAFEVWSAAPQPYTHQETLVVRGDTYERLEVHSAIGATSTAGTLVTVGVDLTLEATCPTARSETLRYSATPTGLVILEGSFIRRYTRM